MSQKNWINDQRLDGIIDREARGYQVLPTATVEQMMAAYNDFQAEWDALEAACKNECTEENNCAGAHDFAQQECEGARWFLSHAIIEGHFGLPIEWPEERRAYEFPAGPIAWAMADEDIPI